MDKNEKSFYNQEDIKDCEQFLVWFTDMIENYPDKFVYYLTENAKLYWFGRTVKGQEKILGFIKTTMKNTKHIFTTAFPSAKFDIRNFNISSTEEDIASSSRKLFALNNNDVYEAPIRSSLAQMSLASTSKYDPLAGGDGPNVGPLTSECYSVMNHINRLPMHSTKTVKQMQSVGAVEFTKPYFKPGVSQTQWQRPCALKIEYSGSLNSPTQYTVNVIAYGDNMTCKKNLLPDFEKCMQDN